MFRPGAAGPFYLSTAAIGHISALCNQPLILNLDCS